MPINDANVIRPNRSVLTNFAIIDNVQVKKVIRLGGGPTFLSTKVIRLIRTSDHLDDG